MVTTTSTLLDICNLHIAFPLEDGIANTVHDVSFSIPHAKTVGLVGESGCGKSMTGLSLLQLVPPPGRIVGGHIYYHRGGAHAASPTPSPVDIATLPTGGDAIRSIRGGEIAMIFQEPMSSLNPVYTIGQQIIEMVCLHRKCSSKDARAVAIDMLKRVGIPAPEQRVDEYPFQLSGGMRQRAMIAMALSCNPVLLIADEPTTALDVTVQAQILDLMRDLQQELGRAILLISHDLGVIADLADEVVVMYAGMVVERGSIEDVLYRPQHPYTQGLLRSAPVLGNRVQDKLYTIPGTVPSPLAMPRGCAFRLRCPECSAKCFEAPQLEELAKGHWVRCWAREGATQ